MVMTGCGRNSEGKDSEEPERTEKPETTVIRLALNGAGHIFNGIAEAQGYLADEGISVEYVPVTTDAEVFEGLRNGTIDIASNSGTNLPLQEIASGMNLTIFAGYLLTGCMPVFAREETPWQGIESLIGKTLACEPNLFALTGPLLDLGYDPLNDINWYETENQTERIEAVRSGQADFGLVGTGLNQAVIDAADLKIVTYAADVLPEYSCCRVEALTSWVDANPNTIKALLRAWIRAMDYYESHHEEAVTLTMKQTGNDEQTVRAYLDNPRHRLDIDPMKKSVQRAWSYMEHLGLLGENSERINIDRHINTQLYKAALDECQKRYWQNSSKFYEKLQYQYAVNDN